MSEMEDRIENMLLKSNNKEVLLQKFKSYFKKEDLKYIEERIEAIIKSNEEKGFDEIFDIVYKYVCMNLPGYVDELFYKNISIFINENIEDA